MLQFMYCLSNAFNPFLHLDNCAKYINGNFWLWRAYSDDISCNFCISSPALHWSSICLIFGSTCCNNDSLTDPIHLWIFFPSSSIWASSKQYFCRVSLQASIWLFTLCCLPINSSTMSSRLWYASNTDMKLWLTWLSTTHSLQISW